MCGFECQYPKRVTSFQDLSSRLNDSSVQQLDCRSHRGSVLQADSGRFESCFL
ncbi:UNVERIFIED_CONTAM: hypothetical protein FKN15_059440 [Acipenser sinensis]